MTGVVGALAICVLLVAAPNLLRSLPSAVLGAVVIAACLSFADLSGMWELLRLRRMEFVLSVISFLGVAFVGVIEGIFITIALALLVLVWNTWHPHSAVLARIDGVKGYHDAERHPQARRVPGLVLFRWDAPLFFANSEIFREQVLKAVAQAPTPTRRVEVGAEAVSDIDITAADVLVVLYDELKLQGIELRFAGLRSHVQDRLRHYGTLGILGEQIFSPTIGSAVNLYRNTYQVDWKDWDET
jgi:MFS superfamily sulfate permease-like transporter